MAGIVKISPNPTIQIMGQIMGQTVGQIMGNQLTDFFLIMIVETSFCPVKHPKAVTFAFSFWLLTY